MNTPDVVIVTWAVKTCPTCGVHYALDAAFNNRNWELGNAWYCPNGHRLVFTEDKATQVQKQLDAANRQLSTARNDRDYFAERLDETDAKLSKTRATLKGSKTRLRNLKSRVAAGVCPAGCKRSFADLAAHIKTKHPDYGGRNL